MTAISLSDLDRFGFDKAEITSFLATHGIIIGRIPEAPKHPPSKIFPEWKQIMALLPALDEVEAAAAFAGIDLGYSGWLSDDAQAALSVWKRVICSAIQSSPPELICSAIQSSPPELIAEATGDLSQKPQYKIKPADLAAWCAAKGREYPLPLIKPLPVTDSELREALATCEQEREQLKSELDKLAQVQTQNRTLQNEIGRLQAEVKEITSEKTKAAAENKKLKDDALAGKTRSTALKIIGGLVKDVYGTDIHAGRLDNIGDIVKALQVQGVDVNEKTLRSYLQEAAKLIQR